MLLSITYTQTPATDLGYLLHKNPSRPQTFKLNYGKAHIFYPEVSKERCTAVLLLDINPIDLARGKIGSRGGLFDYVNDRPYVASSFLSVAISRVFGTAMSGKCKDKPELVEKALPLQARIMMLPCKGDNTIISRIFEPLGYKVTLEEYILDDKFPQWGKSRYNTVSIEGIVRLQDLLNHIYVLIPVLDADKHYWVGEDEIEKLLRHGKGWLKNHPEKDRIAFRYLRKKPSLVRKAFEQLLEIEMEPEEAQSVSNANKEEEPEKKLNLNEHRLNAVLSVLKSVNAKRVIDLGCGEGKLLSLLLKDRSFEQITGVDVSYSVLERAMDRLKLYKLPSMQKDGINIFQSSLTYRDKRFSGYDAATIIEVIEHLDENRLSAFEKVVFKYTRPSTVIISTPNKEYNTHYSRLLEGDVRHKDHRFEWTRQEFKAWSQKIASQYGYSVRFVQIGETDEKYGSPTQMGVFTL
ncbi:MAG: 3' terminal RNA ribose 2'-O-methyltransferase Hen1 [Clostridium sp.]|jgi:3' terminal RNA ribose 2'-O-methyltransferase Hen1|nr:3' terminal RNA ribose 2'-O-methyltransferase Hen1 [Clostridium sp.]